MKNRINKLVPHYKGQKWIQPELPVRVQSWVEGKGKSLRQRSSGHKIARARLYNMVSEHQWRWPKHPVYFITDIHADADALIASLVASGCVRKTGASDRDFRLTKAAHHGRFVIGGDCFDKGPSNLRLLRTLNRLHKRGANFRLLAGNHDIRVMLGMRSVGQYRNQSNEHFFLRMGPKAVPLLREISEQRLDKAALKRLPSNKQVRKLLYPSEQWVERFPDLARDFLSSGTIKLEMERIKKKVERFEHQCELSGLSMREVYAATLQWQKMFLKPGGEFYWFYNRMRLFYRQGSFLFIHAGLDDEVAKMIKHKGVKHVNKRFRKQLKGNDLSFYHGPIANSIRTKYRAADHQLTHKGARFAHESGIHAIIHGHRNVYHGQRIVLRKDLVNFQCDTTMDSGSRVREGLKGAGAGVTIIRPEKLVLGISSDHEYIKVFEPSSLCTQENR
ncbi:metallophosphoesterase [Pseudomonadota bacterium]